MRRDLLNEALLGLREAGDGTTCDEERSNVADETRARLMHTLEQRRHSHHVAAFAVAAVVVLLCASTTWATLSGNLPYVMQELLESISGSPVTEAPENSGPSHTSRVGSSSHQHQSDTIEAEPLDGDEADTAPSSVVTSGIEPQPEQRAQPSSALAPPQTLSSPSGASNPEPSPETLRETQPPPDPQSLYRIAHRAHFVQRDYTAAIVAWDRYLRVAPTGRFALEARYNRAIALARLGRRQSAIVALRPFVDGVHGGYRQDEARRLVEALERFDRPDGS